MNARDLINRMGQLHRLRMIEELADQFAEPLIVFPLKGPSRRAWRADTIASIERLLAANDAAGVTSLTWEELALETQVAGDQSILMRWNYSNHRDEVVAFSEVRYFCGPANGSDLKVLMIEYLSVAFPTALSAIPESDVPIRLN